VPVVAKNFIGRPEIGPKYFDEIKAEPSRTYNSDMSGKVTCCCKLFIAIVRIGVTRNICYLIVKSTPLSKLFQLVLCDKCITKNNVKVFFISRLNMIIQTILLGMLYNKKN